ncbi:MAG: nucleotide exchange factor GrpE [Pseudobdellovibrionaceae bacterium]
MTSDPTFPLPPEEQPSDETPPTPAGFTEVTGPAAFRAQRARPASDPSSLEATLPTPEENQFIKSLEQRITELEQEMATGHDKLLLMAADMENLRKRSQREREDASKYAVSGFARDLLDVADTFRRALLSIPSDLKDDERIVPLVDGIEAMERALLSCFDKNGIKKLDPLGEIFNPHFHEVLFEAPAPDKPNGTIIQVIESGYVLHDRLLRPARVGVSKNASADPQPNIVDTQV